MILGRVVGNVVASHKHAKFDGAKLLLVQAIELDELPQGEPLLAVDSVGAGVGELVVVVVEGRSASQVMRVAEAPANAAIVAIVDRIDRDTELLGTLLSSARRSGD